MIVRPATRADSETISSFWTSLIENSIATFNSVAKSANDVADMIATRPCFLVAVVDDTVVGFASYDQFRGGVGYRHTMEHTIIVDPAAAGMGAGRHLMAALIAHARTGGVHSLWAGVSGENEAGVKFHKSLGFEQIAILPEVGRKFDRWMDLVLMQKRL